MEETNVLIVGSGGREDALGWKCLQSPQAGTIYAWPGNPGMAMRGCHTIPIPLHPSNFPLVADIACQLNVGLAVVGPDNALADGIVPIFKARGLPTFGPEVALIESSKAFAKDIMREAQIPTAKYKIFTDPVKALEHLKDRGWDAVIKVSGLALGKGARVCRTEAKCRKATQDFMVDKIHGSAGDQVIIEEYLEGPEVSIHVLCDGTHVKLFPATQDHKNLTEDPDSDMTGGMGVRGPIDVDLEQIERTIVQPCIDELAKRSLPFVGCLYPGLKMTPDGPKVLEFNARFGDPETQVYMRLLEEDVDIIQVFRDCIEGRADKINLRWRKEKCICVALAAEGYPDKPRKGDEIALSGMYPGITDPIVFQAGTAWKDGGLVTNGGRVLYITHLVKSADDIAWTYSHLDKGAIGFRGMQFRRDIGKGYGTLW